MKTLKRWLRLNPRTAITTTEKKSAHKLTTDAFTIISATQRLWATNNPPLPCLLNVPYIYIYTILYDKIINIDIFRKKLAKLLSRAHPNLAHLSLSTSIQSIYLCIVYVQRCRLLNNYPFQGTACSTRLEVVSIYCTHKTLVVSLF